MTHRVGERGQVVIPRAIREALGLTPGTPVEFAAGADGVEIRPSRVADSLAGVLADGPDMAAGLLEDRRAEPQ